MKTQVVVALFLAALAAFPGCSTLAPNRAIVVTRTGSPVPGAYRLSTPPVPVDHRADDARTVAQLRAELARHGFTEVADPATASLQMAFSWYANFAQAGIRGSNGQFFALRDHSTSSIGLNLPSREKPALGPERKPGLHERPDFARSWPVRSSSGQFHTPSSRLPRMRDRTSEPTVHYLARLTLTGFTIVENQRRESWAIVAETDMTPPEVNLIEFGLISAVTASLDPNAPPTCTFTFSPSRRELHPLAVAP